MTFSPLLVILTAIGLFALPGCLRQKEEITRTPLQCVLDAPSEVRMGERATLTLIVRNGTDSTFEIGLSGRPADYLTVEREDGTVLWQSHPGDAVQDILEMRTLGPRGEWTFPAVWDLRDAGGLTVPPGRYRLRGGVHTDGPEVLRSEPKLIVLKPKDAEPRP